MTPNDPERGLILAYAPAAGRPALAALFALDDALAALLRSTTEPAIGMIRLAWWRERLAALDVMPPPAEPVLRAIAAAVLPHGIRGADLGPIVDGWEALLDEPFDADAIARYAEGRGKLFVLAGRAMGAAPSDPLAEAGQGWALADLARNVETALPDLDAHTSLRHATAARWSRNARALGAMAHLARLNLAAPRDRPIPVGSPRRVARLLWHRLTGS